MNYGVKILFEFDIEDEKVIFYEESIRLFHALSFDEALEKAEKQAETEYSEYVNINGKKIIYKLYEAVEAFSIYDSISFEDGSEVFSTIFSAENADCPIEKRFKSCTAEDMLMLRNAKLNGGIKT